MNTSSLRKGWSLALVASALLAAPATALAQQPPGDQPGQPAPGDQPPPAPPPEATKPAASYPSMGKANEIMLGAETWIRVGLQAQMWADYLQQLSAAGNYSTNFYLRRARVLLGAQITKDVNVFFQTDSPRLGNATQTGTGDTATVSKNFTPMIIQDAWGEVKLLGDELMLEGGLMVVPFSHNELQSTTTFLTLDVANTAVVFAGPTQTSGTRDTGFQLKGYVLEDHLEYRVGVFSGVRNVAAGDNPVAHNAPRITGKLQYQFFDTEKGYTYSGHNFGKKKMIGVSAGFDFQQGDGGADPYLAFSAGVFGSYPLAGEGNKAGGDEISFVGEFYHYDGGTKPTVAGLPAQNDFLAEAAYYNKDLKLSVFGKFEMLKTSDDANKAANRQWFGGGLKYYVLPGNNCNFTLAFNRIQLPDAQSGAPNGQNEVTLQLQVYYY